MRNNRWSREQLKLAFHLYCQLPFGKLHSRNSEIVELAQLIGRTPSAVAMKLVNFASLDHPWHEFFIVRPADENDLAMGAPWGTASALFQAITEVTR